jgi:hypothetical protein
VTFALRILELDDGVNLSIKVLLERLRLRRPEPAAERVNRFPRRLNGFSEAGTFKGPLDEI